MSRRAFAVVGLSVVVSGAVCWSLARYSYAAQKETPTKATARGTEVKDDDTTPVAVAWVAASQTAIKFTVEKNEILVTAGNVVFTVPHYLTLKQGGPLAGGRLIVRGNRLILTNGASSIAGPEFSFEPVSQKPDVREGKDVREEKIETAEPFNNRT